MTQPAVSADHKTPRILPADIAAVLARQRRWALRQGDSTHELAHLPDASVDAIVTDPPAGIEFMGKDWDSFSGDSRQPNDDTFHKSGVGPFDRAKVRHSTTPGYKSRGAREGFIAAMTAIFEECYRVLKPGAHALIWALPRTSHWTASAIEDAGFEVRDIIYHAFGSGFPKSLDVSKAIDKAAGATREVVGFDPTSKGIKPGQNNYGGGSAEYEAGHDITAPATEDAKQWAGWGTALKPAQENWILARKPLDGTVAENVLAHGVGGINIDACRIGNGHDGPAERDQDEPSSAVRYGGYGGAIPPGPRGGSPDGRFPANFILSHSPECRLVGEVQVRGNGHFPVNGGKVTGVNSDGWVAMQTSGWSGTGVPSRTLREETVDSYECVPGCPVAELDTQSGVTRDGVAVRKNVGGSPKGMFDFRQENLREDAGYGGVGGASRFFYTAKADQFERHDGVTGKNTHPTVKSTDLMRWLCRLITPPGGVVLDPFAGSGSTGVACMVEGYRFIGIEREAEYARIARERIDHWTKPRPLAVAKALKLPDKSRKLTDFGGDSK